MLRLQKAFDLQATVLPLLPPLDAQHEDDDRPLSPLLSPLLSPPSASTISASASSASSSKNAKSIDGRRQVGEADEEEEDDASSSKKKDNDDDDDEGKKKSNEERDNNKDEDEDEDEDREGDGDDTVAATTTTTTPQRPFARGTPSKAARLPRRSPLSVVADESGTSTSNSNSNSGAASSSSSPAAAPASTSSSSSSFRALSSSSSSSLSLGGIDSPFPPMTPTAYAEESWKNDVGTASTDDLAGVLSNASYREPHRWQSELKSKLELARNLKIVGQERFGVLLLSWEGYENNVKKTFVDVYNMKTGERSTIYRHHHVTNIVSASVNQDNTLLVFTQFGQYSMSSTEAIEDIYDTCMVEIQPQNRLFSLGDPSKKYQRVQFLENENSGQKNKTKAVHYLLFILHKEYVHVYSLPMVRVKVSPSVCWRIMEQPRKEYSVAKRFLWCQWDMNNKVLYYVYVKPNPKEQTQRMECMLRAIDFAEDGKPEIQMDLPLPLRFRRNPMDDTTYVHLPCARAVPDMHFHMEIVRIDSNAICACVQYIDETASVGRSIHVAVFLLHYRSKLEFVISTSNFPSPNVLASRVFFAPLDSFLIIYIPGHYLQFVDCGSEHEPSPSLLFTGSEMATSLPNDDSALLYHPVCLSHFESLSNGSKFSFSMYDCRTDVAYTYAIDEQALLRLYGQTSSSAAHIQAVHLAVTHLQNPTIVSKLVHGLCSQHPQYMTTEVLKEYLIGLTYLEMREGKYEAQFLKLLPISCIATFAEESMDESRRKSEKFGEVDPLQRRTPERRGVPSRFSFEPHMLSSLPSSAVSMATSSPAGQVQKKIHQFMAKMFGSSTDEAPSPKGKNADDEIDLAQRQKYVDTLAEYLAAHLPKESKSKCYNCAKDYVKCQANQVTYLWKLIESTLGLPTPDAFPVNRAGDVDSKLKAGFQLLEHFYCALEELFFPFPPSFHTSFSLLGLHCLPRHVFVQYLERGVFHLTDAFVSHAVLQTLGASHSLADCHFKFFLLSHMSNKKQAIKLMRKLSENDINMSEYILSEFLNSVDQDSDDDDDGGDAHHHHPVFSGSTEDLESSSSSVGGSVGGHSEVVVKDHRFLPFNYLVANVRSRGMRNSDWEFLNRSYETCYSDQ